MGFVQLSTIYNNKLNYFTQALQQQQQQQKKRLYRCQVCSTSFDSRLNCLEHIQKDHNTASTTSTNEVHLNLTKHS